MEKSENLNLRLISRSASKIQSSKFARKIEKTPFYHDHTSEYGSFGFRSIHIAYRWKDNDFFFVQIKLKLNAEVPPFYSSINYLSNDMTMSESDELT